MIGKVKFYNIAKNFGFLIGEDENEYFIHVTDCISPIEKSDRVEFEPTQSDKGPQAKKCIKILEE